MSQIPFSPPQVQAALQNPTRFPDQKLQQYARGQQPTGQVSPMMAQQEMATRNQERQAFQRQQAMQNNPENSPTVFQQKDMQLQQAMQALQQKEQQLGLAGAMLAKKQQDLAAREQGIAALPVNPNMFTAMDGGIVFSGGGAVQRFNGTGSSTVSGLLAQSEDEFYGSPRNRAEANKVDLLRQIELLRPEEQAKLLEPGTLGTQPDAYILRRRLQEMGYDVDPKTNKIRQLEEQGRRPITMQERRALDYIAKELSATPNEATVRLPSGQKGTPSTTTPQSTTPSTPSVPSAPGIASLGAGTSFQSQMKALDPYLKASVDRSESTKLNAELVKTYEDIKNEIAAGRMTEEEGQRIIANKKAEMAAEYADYTKGREGRREKARAAIEGEKPSIWSGIAAGLPTDTRGLRIAGLLGGLAKGVAGKESEYENRKREAAKYMAEAEELDAKADLAERRGQSREAEAFRDKAEDRKLRSAQTSVSMLQAGQGGIKAALEQARAGESEQARQLSSAAQAATGIAGSLISAGTQRDIARYNAENQRRLAEYQVANRERNPYLQMADMLVSTGMDKKEAIGFVLGRGEKGLSSAVEGKIVEDVINKYANPHSPRVVAAVEKLDPNAARILRLPEKEAMNQPGYAAALDLVERAKRQEMLTVLNRPQSFTSLPAPPSK